MGKTESGIAWAIDRLLTGDVEIAYIGPTHTDLKKEIIPRLVAKLHETFGEENITTNLSDGIITVQKYKVIKLYSSENEIRGGNFNSAVAEELCKWCQNQPDKIEEAWKLLNMAVRRKGINPCQIFIASTPKNYSIFSRFDKECEKGNPLYIQKILTIDDATYLDEASRRAIIEDNKGRLGRQELYADLLTDTPGAYWTRELLDKCIRPLPMQYPKKTNKLPTNDQLMGREPMPVPPPADAVYLVRTVIGFDPAVSKGGDECGISIVKLYSDGKAYVVADKSGNYNPDEWSKLIHELYQEYDASCVVVEKNNGGNLFEHTLHSVNKYMKIVPIHAREGKTTRAEHTSALYYQDRVYHTDTFPYLEDQMCTFSVNYTKSPDRLDALNLAITELFFPTQATGTATIRNLPSW